MNYMKTFLEVSVILGTLFFVTLCIIAVFKTPDDIEVQAARTNIQDSCGIVGSEMFPWSTTSPAYYKRVSECIDRLKCLADDKCKAVVSFMNIPVSARPMTDTEYYVGTQVFYHHHTKHGWRNDPCETTWKGTFKCPETM